MFCHKTVLYFNMLACTLLPLFCNHMKCLPQLSHRSSRLCSDCFASHYSALSSLRVGRGLGIRLMKATSLFPFLLFFFLVLRLRHHSKVAGDVMNGEVMNARGKRAEESALCFFPLCAEESASCCPCKIFLHCVFCA